MPLCRCEDDRSHRYRAFIIRTCTSPCNAPQHTPWPPLMTLNNGKVGYSRGVPEIPESERNHPSRGQGSAEIPICHATNLVKMYGVLSCHVN